MIKRSKISGESPLYGYKNKEENRFEESIPLEESKMQSVTEEKGSRSVAALKMPLESSPSPGRKEEPEMVKSMVKEDMFSSSVMIIQGGQKLIKINKKKSIISNLTIKILSNNGHSSLVALSSIILYSITGDPIQIS